MRTNIQEIIDASPAQHSLDWYRARLGHFTGSQVGRLMKKGRGKDAEWSADALTYIKEVVAERLLNPVVTTIDEFFQQYLDLVNTSSKMMAWGIDNEMLALGIYVKMTGSKVTHCGSLPHETVQCFWDSPDGLLLNDNGVVEVKCPAPKTHADYLINVKTPEDLQSVKPEYYWQAISHMAVTGAQFCDWMSYCKFSQIPLHIIRFERDEDIIAQLLERITKADEMAQELMDKAMQKTSGHVVIK